LRTLPTRTPPISPLFPYTTLFRSRIAGHAGLRSVARQRTGMISTMQLGTLWRRFDDYLELTKPRVVTLIVFTAIVGMLLAVPGIDRKSTRLNSSHVKISYAVFCLK